MKENGAVKENKNVSSPPLSLSLSRSHLALSRSLSVDPTICLTLPLWMSMQGRKAEGSARAAFATRRARR